MAEILCIVDGMTDEQFHLQQMPHLAELAMAGTLEYRDTTPEGHATGTLPCTLRILGCPPEQIPHHARGWLEAIGMGIPVPDNALVVRATWVHVDNFGRIVHPAPAPGQVKLPPGATYYPQGESKGLVVLEGLASACDEIVTRPPHEHWGNKLGALAPDGCDAVIRLFFDNMTSSAVLMPWGQSHAQTLWQSPKLRGAALVAATPIILGLGKALGMSIVPVAGATGGTDTDLTAKVKAALRAAEDHDFVLLHLEGADDASHHLDRAKKLAFLTQIDNEVVARLAQSPHQVQICSDHGTSPHTGYHLNIPQPFITKPAKE